MAMISSAKVLELSEITDKDPTKKFIGAVDLDGVTTHGENLLVITYIRPRKTSGGILRPDDNIKEDEFQGNVGLVVQVGDDFDDEQANELLHTWVVFGCNDGLRYRYDGVPLRIIPYNRVRQTVPDPFKVL